MPRKKKQLAEDVVEKAPVVTTPDEQSLIERLFKYTTPEYLPTRAEYMSVVKECYDFKELRQWNGQDMQSLAQGSVPAVSVDRIGRSLDTINGIRTNTGSKKNIVKREMGDEATAKVLNLVADFDDYNSDFASAKDEAFNAMLDVGLGVRKIGYDPTANGGEGMMFSDFCEIEDVGFGRHKKKNLEDIPWGWHRTMMDWTDAILLNTEKAPQLKTLQTKLESEWDKMKSGNVKSNFATKDYQINAYNAGDGRFSYNGQVYVYEFWQKKVVPQKKILSMVDTPLPGTLVSIPMPQVRMEPIDYTPAQGEEHIATTSDIVWCQYQVAAGLSKSDSILLTQAETTDHPFVGTCASRRKSGMERGFIEGVIDHQKRINIAWAQKTAYNNKAIKSPLIVNGKIDIETAVQQSSFGAILQLDHGTKVESVNTQPQVNLQAIEEGQSARQDMDFAAAASEPVLRGQISGTSSGIQLAQQQNAAVTPLNKWVKAEQDAELLFWRKWLKLAITNYKPERIARIIGNELWAQLTQPQVDQMGNIIAPPQLQLPFDPKVEEYDVVIEDQSLSDLNKQQSFNAVMAMKSGGILFDDAYVIKNAPIKNTEDALASNQKARGDMIMMLMNQVQMLEAELQQTQKLIPKENRVPGQPNRNPSQPGNAQIGRNTPQHGKQSMIGGTSPNTVFGVQG